MVVSAEDGTDTIRRRIAGICNAELLDPVEVSENLIALDATAVPCLFQEVSAGGVRRGDVTENYHELKKFIDAEGIGFLIVDNASDVYGANPIDRQQVTKFVRSLVRLVHDAGGAVLLLSHVNKVTSRNGKYQTDTESYADSAAWHNAPRSRLFLNSENDTGSLGLYHQKTNFGKKQGDLFFSFRDDGLSLAANDEQYKDSVLPKRLIQRIALLKLIQEFYLRGEWITTSYTSCNTNAHIALKNEDAYPFSNSKSGKAECFSILRECERASLLFKEDYKKPDRHDGERWKLTELGHDSINTK